VTADDSYAEFLGWLKSELPDSRWNVRGYALILRCYDIILLVALDGELTCGLSLPRMPCDDLPT
jgi:hypothetical protein